VLRARPRPDAVACLVLGVVLLAAIAACSSSGQQESASNAIIARTPNPGGYRGAVLDRPYVMPELTFTDTSGEEFRLREDTKAPVTLVFFGYTYCPDVCPTVLADVAAALRRMDAAQRAKIQLLFLTTDPARDKPRVIRAYLDRFDRSFVGLTGGLGDIEQAARALGVPLTGTSKLPGGGYEVGHGAQVIGFTSDDNGRLVWLPGTSVGDLRHDFTKLAASA
jgi:protein SCO1/2